MSCADNCTKSCSLIVGVWGILLFIIFLILGIGGLWNIITGTTAVDPTFDLAITAFFLFSGIGGLLFIGYKLWSAKRAISSNKDNLEIKQDVQLSKERHELNKHQTTLDEMEMRETKDSELDSGKLDDPQLWKNRGNEFFTEKKFEEAIKCYAHAIELNRDYSEAWNNMGLAFLKMGLPDEAKKCNQEIKRIKDLK